VQEVKNPARISEDIERNTQVQKHGWLPTLETTCMSTPDMGGKSQSHHVRLWAAHLTYLDKEVMRRIIEVQTDRCVDGIRRKFWNLRSAATCSYVTCAVCFSADESLPNL